jgi:hypothetical protein
MAERKLPSRRKKASKGKVIRVSNLVYEMLNKQRYGKSWDNLFRKMFGFPDRAGNTQPLVEGVLETMTGKFLLKDVDMKWDRLEEDAYEIAILTAARRKEKRVSRPIKMREIA